MAKSEWPKKMPAGDYAKRWYTSRTKQSIINDIKGGHLPGTQEPSGQWFVWVNSDDSAAFGYSPPAQKKAQNDSVVTSILSKVAMA